MSSRNRSMCLLFAKKESSDFQTNNFYVLISTSRKIYAIHYSFKIRRTSPHCIIGEAHTRPEIVTNWWDCKWTTNCSLTASFAVCVRRRTYLTVFQWKCGSKVDIMKPRTQQRVVACAWKTKATVWFTHA